MVQSPWSNKLYNVPESTRRSSTVHKAVPDSVPHWPAHHRVHRRPGQLHLPRHTDSSRSDVALPDRKSPNTATIIASEYLTRVTGTRDTSVTDIAPSYTL